MIELDLEKSIEDFVDDYWEQQYENVTQGIPEDTEAKSQNELLEDFMVECLENQIIKIKLEHITTILRTMERRMRKKQFDKIILHAIDEEYKLAYKIAPLFELTKSLELIFENQHHKITIGNEIACEILYKAKPNEIIEINNYYGDTCTIRIQGKYKLKNIDIQAYHFTSGMSIIEHEKHNEVKRKNKNYNINGCVYHII